MVGTRQVNKTGIDDVQPPHQHMVELDERTEQAAPLRPGANPSLTGRTVRIGHSFGDLAKARMTL